MCSMRRQVQLEQRGTGWGGGQDHREACGDDSPVQGQSHEIGVVFGLHRPLQPHLFLPSSPFTSVVTALWCSVPFNVARFFSFQHHAHMME